jgi:L-rhamnose mutarotase
MKREAFLLKVKPDAIPEYKRMHAAIWDDMKQSLRDTGWHNYSLFIREDGLLFGYVETDEGIEKALAGMATQDPNIRWPAAVAHLFEGRGGKNADQSFIILEEVFHLD